MSKLLSRLGFEVLSASNGPQAVELAQKDSQIDLVILDMEMPEWDGKRTFLELKKVSPQIKVILSTGYGRNEKAQSIMDLGVDELLVKPFSIKQLKQKINSLLD